MPFKHKQKYFGFSLIEMLVTVGIISILVASAVGYYVWAPEKTRRTKMVAEINLFHEAALRYYAKFSGWPRKLSDLNGLGVLRIPRDPWGGEYKLEEEYYITCRPPSGGAYRIPLCPKILYSMHSSCWFNIVPVNKKEIDEKAKGRKQPFEIKVRLKMWPRVDDDVIEYRSLSSEDIDAIYHKPPPKDKLIYYGRPVDGMYDPISAKVIWFEKKLRIFYDDDLYDYAYVTAYKFTLCESKILRTYYYHFGNKDGDVDMDRKAEVKITYEGDAMIVYDLDEDVGGVNKEYIEMKVQEDKKKIWYHLGTNDFICFWDPNYYCRWSVY